MKVELRKIFSFEAAHRLPNAPEGHKCARVHGHTFRIEVRVAGKLDDRRGWLVDHADISRAMEPLIQKLDHQMLNEVEGLDNPTMEKLAVWFWERLHPAFPGLSKIIVHETDQAGCSYEGS
jgi:6-pyruvoyltetrahydropterin/6-carboxytetrahydropterin synthase